VQLVVLAAGHGRRFGGLKQLAAVGPNGEALMDYTARDAVGAGFSEVLLVVREEVRDELLEHIAEFWPTDLKVVPVVQGPVAGTAQAVASAGPELAGTFGVVNADDLYGGPALRKLGEALPTLASDEHLIVSYRLADTVLTDAPVTRGVCVVDGSGYLERVVEHTVQIQPDGSFLGRPLRWPDAEMAPVSGDVVVSMNLWGFAPSAIAGLDAALARFDPAAAPRADGKPAELLLPDVVGALVSSGVARVRVVQARGRCIGITHPDDLPLVRSIVAETEADAAAAAAGLTGPDAAAGERGTT
jgi:microcompartment protein CcmK/EutM